MYVALQREKKNEKFESLNYKKEREKRYKSSSLKASLLIFYLVVKVDRRGFVGKVD